MITQTLTLILIQHSTKRVGVRCSGALMVCQSQEYMPSFTYMPSKLSRFPFDYLIDSQSRRFIVFPAPIEEIVVGKESIPLACFFKVIHM